jgi:hypothetical protein
LKDVVPPCAFCGVDHEASLLIRKYAALGKHKLAIFIKSSAGVGELKERGLRVVLQSILLWDVGE